MTSKQKKFLAEETAFAQPETKLLSVRLPRGVEALGEAKAAPKNPRAYQGAI